MNFFKKKITVKHTDLLETIDAKNMFSIIPKNFPNYFSSIPKTVMHPKSKKYIPYYRTIKTCPAFINLFKRSLLVKSPFDIFMEFNDVDVIHFKAGQTNFPAIEKHTGLQFLDYVPQNKFKFIIKLNLPIVFETNVSLHLSESNYHFNNFSVLPGIFPKNSSHKMIVFIPIEKEKNELFIRKGDPICILTPLCESSIKLNFEELKNGLKPFLTFSSLKKYVLKNLIHIK